MKKIFVETIMAAVLLLQGCGASEAAQSAEESASASSTPSPSIAAVIPSSGNADGMEGERMRTKFFDFIANYSQITSDYQGISPDSGKNLLVVNVTIENTADHSVEMFDTDFQAQWGDDDASAYAVPVTFETDLSADGMLATQYTLESKQEITGDLVFEVPVDASEYELCYEEVFEDGTTGDTFFVTLSPVE